MNRTLALIAARMGSSRLPGKALAPVGETTLLGLLLQRLRAVRGLDEIVLATTVLPEDDALESWAEQQGLAVHRGDAEDVLGRLVGAVDAHPADRVVEVLGDNPFVPPALVEATLARLEESGAEFVSTATNELPHCPPELPRFAIGIRVQAFRADCLRRACAATMNPDDREHATRFIVSHPGEFSLGYLPAAGSWAVANRPEWTLAVNHDRNLELVRKLHEALAAGNGPYGLEAIFARLDREPSWQALLGPPPTETPPRS